MRSTLRSKGVCYNYKGLGSNNFPHSCDSFATPHYHPLLGGKAVTAVPAITPPLSHSCDSCEGWSEGEGSFSPLLGVTAVTLPSLRC
jgi:hypothetical protein